MGRNLIRSARRLALGLALAAAAAGAASAQHEIDPETWVQMRKMFEPKGPPPAVADDIAALANRGKGPRRAGPRLVERGPEILPELHAALLSPNADGAQRLHLVQVLIAIGDASSVDPILEIVRRDSQAGMRRDLLLALSLLPQTEASFHFMTQLAENPDEPWNTRRMLFTYFGMHRDGRGRKWAEPLLDDADAERRGAALFLLAQLGDARALEPITQILREGAPANMRAALLLSLAELTGPAEFEARAPAALAWSDDYKDSLRYARYRALPESERAPVCKEMLRSGLPGHSGIAVRCLLDRGLEQELLPHIALDLESPGRRALLRSEVRRAGYRIIDTDEDFRIEPAPASPAPSDS